MAVIQSYNLDKVVGGSEGNSTVFAVQNGIRSNTVNNITELNETTWDLHSSVIDVSSITGDTDQLSLEGYLSIGEHTIPFSVAFYWTESNLKYLTFGNSYYMYLKTSDTLYITQDLSDGDGWYAWNENTNELEFIDSTGTVTIEGFGADSSNADLIAWFQTNAEQIIENSGTSSFSAVEVVDNHSYITLIINGVSFNCKKSEE